MTDSHEKLCLMVCEFGGVCQRIKLRIMSVRVKSCSWNGNDGRMHGIINGEPLEEVACCMYLWSQVAADGGYERDVLH